MKAVIFNSIDVVRERGKSSFSAIAMLALSLIMLSGCFGESPPFGAPQCVESDSWGNNVSVEMTVPAKEAMTSAGIKVRAGEPLEISVSGLVDLCPSPVLIEPTPQGVAKRASDINANESVWQQAKNPDGTDILVNPGERLSIVVDGKYQDRNGDVENGRGLYAYIGKTPPPESVWWFGAEVPDGSSVPIENKNAINTNGAPVQYPNFFELYDNGTVDEASGYYGVLPDTIERESKIWFKYARTAVRSADNMDSDDYYTSNDVTSGAISESKEGANKKGIDREGSFRYSPWKGHYAWENNDKCNACNQLTINSVCAAAAVAAIFAYPVAWRLCVAAWHGGCAGTGHAEEAVNLRGNNGRYCREHYPSAIDPIDGDQDPNNIDISDQHWVNSAYNIEGNDPATGKLPNAGGYNIRISAGCPGTHGQFMEAMIGTTGVTLKDKTEPEGCKTPGSNGCSYVVDSWSGQRVKVPVHTMSSGYPMSLDLRCVDGSGVVVNSCPNTPYIGRGKFKGLVPESGELWFHIKDEERAGPPDYGVGDYSDNAGEYKVILRTSKVDEGFSDSMNSLIKPIRGIIFGYCRIYDDPLTPDLDESAGKYSISQDDCGTARWSSGITQRMYQKLVGGTTECVPYDGSEYINDPDYEKDGNTGCVKEVGSGDLVQGPVKGNPFLTAVRAALVLFVVIYAFFFMLGMVDDAQAGFLKRSVKFAIVAVLLSPGSWAFFNEYLFAFFIHGIDDLIAKMSGEFSGAVANVLVDPTTGREIKDSLGNSIAVNGNSNLFAFADMTIAKFFNIDVFIKIICLLFASPLGWLYVILILAGMFYYVYALIQAMILYLMALLSIALLLVVAPIFITMILFERTKGFFDQWIKLLMNYTLQPVLVFTVLAMFNVFVYSALYYVLHYRSCWSHLFDIDFGLFKIPLYFYLPDSSNGLPISMFMLLIFIIICNAMLKFIDWSAKIASHLTIGGAEATLMVAASGAMKAIQGGAQGILAGGFGGMMKRGAQGAGMAAPKGADGKPTNKMGARATAGRVAGGIAGGIAGATRGGIKGITGI